MLTTLMLTACSSNGFFKDVKDKTVALGKTVGLVEENTMKKPDYYSSKQIEKNYEFGRSYQIQKLECSYSENACE
ncbi:MAG: hypothetical protein R3254_00400 [Thiomicrorhabdus sp.]|nr:hypothetical protein [Thiomicrorhabdus sp.]